MAKERQALTLIGLRLDPEAPMPLYRQLYRELRRAILDRRLSPGQQLPATRALAEHFSVSRSTVLLAYEHLVTEGYAEGKTGAGTFVSRTIPEDLLRAVPMQNATPATEAASLRLSRRAEALGKLPFRNHPPGSNLRPFQAGVPALREFPFDLWRRLLGQESQRLTFNDYGYIDPAGYMPLREAIAGHLRTARAVKCEAGQVIITTGTQQALDLACRLLINPGEPAWVEDPGYIGAKEAFTASEARPVPVPVDDEGLQVAYGMEHCPDARLAYITPSHQYPTAVTMSLPRRLELLEWAQQQQAWILEDDYDSEYRYEGRPLSSLQGIDRGGRVIYFGTFSKVLFPGLRIGYLVVPPALTEIFSAAKDFTDRQNAVLEQAVLTRFIREGYFGRHLRRMRLLYQERQKALLQAAKTFLPGRLEIQPSDTGLHTIGFLPPGTDDTAIARKLRKTGIYANPVSAYTLRFRQRPALVLGYAPFSPAEIEKAVQAIGKNLGF